MTPIREIILTCLLGSEDRSAWKRERQRDRVLKFRTPAANADYAEKKRRRRREDLDFAALERERQKKRREDPSTGTALKEQAKGRRKRRRDFFNLLKLDRPCYDCGGVFPPEAMDWDHLPGSNKCFNIGANIYLYSTEEVADEINKCQLVCSNCHRVRTTVRKQQKG